MTLAVEKWTEDSLPDSREAPATILPDPRESLASAVEFTPAWRATPHVRTADVESRVMHPIPWDQAKAHIMRAFGLNSNRS
jgi:hypothetical protein